MKYIYSLLRILMLTIICGSNIPAFADSDIFEVEVLLENHVFTPCEIAVPKNKKIKLVIYNADPTIEEFDSTDLKREKLLRSKSKTNIILAPLAAGRYDFVGEFNHETAKGTVIVE